MRKKMGQSANAIKIGIVDDQKLSRDGLMYHLQKTETFDVIWQTSRGKEALAYCLDNPPDILILDISLPDIGGLQITSAIRSNNIYCKILAISADPEIEKAARFAGVDEFLRKDKEYDDNFLMDTLIDLWLKKDVAKPKIDLESIDSIESSMIKLSSELVLSLRSRQLAVLRLLAEGLSPNDISERLAMKLTTVRSYIKEIHSDLKVSSNSEAIVLAYKSGIIEMPKR